MRLARLEHDLGSYALAEKHYARALEMVDGKTPSPSRCSRCNVA